MNENAPPTYQIISYGSEAYVEALAIRQSLLRDPLGLKYTEKELAPEKDDTHIAAMLDGKVVAYLFLRPEDKTTVKFRQVVVNSTVQGRGIGGGLIAFAENVAKQQGYNTTCLHARETAIRFYEKQGYIKSGESVELVTLPHWYMSKRLG